jgi:hypothetical protein
MYEEKFVNAEYKRLLAETELQDDHSLVPVIRQMAEKMIHKRKIGPAPIESAIFTELVLRREYGYSCDNRKVPTPSGLLRDEIYPYPTGIRFARGQCYEFRDS